MDQTAPEVPAIMPGDALGPDNVWRLVQLACNGDREAFGELISEHYDFIYRAAYKWCGSQEDAEDVAQDVCIKLPKILGGYEGRSAFRSWLYRIIINTVRDMQRTRARRRDKLDAWAQTSDQGSDLTQGIHQETHLENADLWAAVRALPPRQRDCMLLVYAEQASHAETAQILGCGESTVSWHIHEAKKSLKEQV